MLQAVRIILELDLAFQVLPVAGATQPSPSLQPASALVFISFP